MDNQQALQGAEYSFPYHYLPQLSPRNFRSHRAWDWSLSYVTALRLVTDKLRQLDPASLIDVGCGDGALVHHLQKALPQVRLAGIDYDERAIGFARLFTPGAEFIAGDIAATAWDRPFKAATLVEVIEHIPPVDLPGFLGAVRKIMADDGHLIVTVPHVNKPLEQKHYQHFSFDSLRDALSPNFEVEEMFGFERLVGWKRTISRLTNNRYLFAELRPLNGLLFRNEIRFQTTSEKGCGRIFALARCRRPDLKAAQGA